MRRVKTLDNLDRSCNSETKRRMTREELKRYKLHKLKLKFKHVVQQINELKHENNEDHQQLTELILNSDRIQRLALESREKTQRICTESKDTKRRLTLPAVLENKNISAFTLKQDSKAIDGQQHSNNMPDTSQIREEAPDNLNDGAKVKQKEESKLTAHNQVRASKQTTANTQLPSFIEESSAQKIDSKFISLSIKVKQAQPARQNRFYQEWSKNETVLQPVLRVKKGKKKKERQSIQPFIWTFLVAIVASLIVTY